VRQGEEETFVRLLWVSCPPPDAKNDKQTKDHAAYFGISEEDALAVGREAQAFSEKYLSGKPLTLITRGSQDEEGHVLVAVRSGRLGELSGALVDHGLAMIHPPGAKKGPARQHEEAVLRNLAEREGAAKARPIPPGAWARSEGK
jgi:endonuclease YncB( thermonuclease family)